MKAATDNVLPLAHALELRAVPRLLDIADARRTLRAMVRAELAHAVEHGALPMHAGCTLARDIRAALALSQAVDSAAHAARLDALLDQLRALRRRTDRSPTPEVHA